MGSTLTLVDAHVHIYSCFRVAALVEEASSNFAQILGNDRDDGRFVGVLCLTTSPDGRRFSWLKDTLSTALARWSSPSRRMKLIETQEDASFRLSSVDGDTLVVIAGRQITSIENLEVLAIGTREELESGIPAELLIERIAGVGAIPIIPWGVGKWLGHRGQRVKEMIRDKDLPRFFLGDSGNRPKFWPRPRQFEMAEERGIRNLPGSDPLPFPDEFQRVGSYGTALKGELDPETPFRNLKERLLSRSTTFQPFGEQEAPLRFVRNQLKMQLRKLTH